MPDTPRSALVTGASRGIGRAIALRLGAAGHRVVVNYNSHPKDADEVVTAIRKNGGAAIALKANVAVKGELEAMFKAAEDAHGPVEILINNAGIIRDTLLIRMKDEDWDAVINTNLKGTYWCCKLAVPGMLKGRWGRIINISSVVGLRGNVGQANYSASKGAIHSLTYSLAKELATRSITVNTIAPGYVETATVDVLSPQLKAKILTWVPMGRFGTPDEVASAADFLAREEARYITGVVLRVDGGMAI
ncbi:MAG: 3-oxoacyl-[acyl-carrier-protein] reductase [Chloroflexi bacterium]|nr:3-oxoacyl-[acyl-carrier-protein] reductase [Chloroflexota bacterium]